MEEEFNARRPQLIYYNLHSTPMDDGMEKIWLNNLEKEKIVDVTTEEDKLDPVSDIPEGDIQLVMEQVHCSRAMAIQTLLKHQGDIVNAIMELTE